MSLQYKELFGTKIHKKIIKKNIKKYHYFRKSMKINIYIMEGIYGVIREIGTRN
jgi:hypothetical protein